MATAGRWAPPRPPSAEVMAFAVSIVQSKPPDLSVGEYIRLLRLHIAKGSRAGAVSSKYQHLDRSAYWRSESERMSSALKNTEDEVVDLRREVDSLKAKLDAAKSALPTKKRKKIDEDTIPYPRSPKRAKLTATSTKNSSLDVFDSSVEAEFSEAGEIGNILLRSLFRLHAILKSHNKIEPIGLTYHLVRASSTVSQLVLDEVRSFVGSDYQADDGMKRMLLLARRAINSIVVAFNRRSHMPDDGGNESEAIHAVVHMFQELLTGLALLSKAETKRALKVETTLRISAADKMKSKGKTPRILNIKENLILSAYTTFLASLMDLLDPKIEANHALFEGFTFCVLESLGTRMYHSFFGHVRGETLESEILQSHSPDDTSDNEILPQAGQQCGQKQVRLEAPYLIALLERIMAATPSYFGAAKSEKTGKPRQAHGRASMKGALAIEAKDRLQRTLVACIFGGSEGMSSDPFAECLKMPVDKGSISMPKVKEADVQDWFKGEMWRLLGWEILSKEGDW